ncbi:hypothetical protein ACK8P5_10855 [Paenibacillus sp. EC2-1]|uniref:hypothetical protein n=1 Tax=Paenibacillus sp. EC2-1 TaxID=3388665 RepID=UPI003BEF1D98
MNEIKIDTVTLDSAVKMIKLTYSLELWEQLIDLSNKLYIRANHIYKNRFMKPIRVLAERPLVYYYGYSLLMKGHGYKELGRYDKALQCIDRYSNLYWFEEDFNEDDIREVQYFQYISEPNRFEIHLLSGDFNSLDAYVDYLARNRNELLPGLISILKAANNHNYNIDSIINRFSHDIVFSVGHASQDVINTAYYQSFLQQIIDYKINHFEHHSAIDYTFQLLFYAHKAANDGLYKHAIVCFESLREYATPIQLTVFKEHITSIMGKVLI